MKVSRVAVNVGLSAFPIGVGILAADALIRGAEPVAHDVFAANEAMSQACRRESAAARMQGDRYSSNRAKIPFVNATLLNDLLSLSADPTSQAAVHNLYRDERHGAQERFVKAMIEQFIRSRSDLTAIPFLNDDSREDILLLRRAFDLLKEGQKRRFSLQKEPSSYIEFAGCCLAARIALIDEIQPYFAVISQCARELRQ